MHTCLFQRLLRLPCSLQLNLITPCRCHLGCPVPPSHPMDCCPHCNSLLLAICEHRAARRVQVHAAMCTEVALCCAPFGSTHFPEGWKQQHAAKKGGSRACFVLQLCNVSKPSCPCFGSTLMTFGFEQPQLIAGAADAWRAVHSLPHSSL